MGPKEVASAAILAGVTLGAGLGGALYAETLASEPSANVLFYDAKPCIDALPDEWSGGLQELPAGCQPYRSLFSWAGDNVPVVENSNSITYKNNLYIAVTKIDFMANLVQSAQDSYEGQRKRNAWTGFATGAGFTVYVGGACLWLTREDEKDRAQKAQNPQVL